MALQKDMTISGNIYNYHKIRKLTIDSINEIIIAEILHYKDRDYRLSNSSDFAKRSVLTFNVPSLVDTIKDKTFLQVVTYLYDTIKAARMEQQVIDGELQVNGEGDPIMINTNWYTGSTDVLE